MSATKARQIVLADLARPGNNHESETKALVFTTHFAESSVGRVSREGDRLTWHFA